MENKRQTDTKTASENSWGNLLPQPVDVADELLGMVTGAEIGARVFSTLLTGHSLSATKVLIEVVKRLSE